MWRLVSSTPQPFFIPPATATAESNSRLEPGEVRAWGTVVWSKSRTEEREYTHILSPQETASVELPEMTGNTMGAGAKFLQSNR